MVLYVSDLDGTLLTNKGTLSEYSRNKLNNLIHSGLNFTVASFRSVTTMQKAVKGLRLSLPVINYNGAFISDLQTGQHYTINDLNTDLAREIHDLLYQSGNHPIVSTFNGKEDCLNCPECLNEGMSWYYNDRLTNNDPRLRKQGSLNKIFNENVVCLTVINRKEYIEELSRRVQETYDGYIETHLFENQYQPGWYWLTVQDVKASKDRAIRTLAEEHGFDLKKLTVFGDEVNDIKMFKIAANAVAVGNAIDELKKCASAVISTNEEDSVVKYILENNAGFSLSLSEK